jgi:hypothetical protein
MHKTIHTYADLHNLAEKFFQHEWRLLVIASRTGQGNTERVKKLAGGFDAWYCRATRSTACKFFIKLYQLQDTNVVLDDVDALKNKASYTPYRTCATRLPKAYPWSVVYTGPLYYSMRLCI